MILNYERPDFPKVVGEILKGLLPDDQMGTDRVDTAQRFYELDQDEFADVSSMDFITLRRRGGYLTETYTDVAGIEVMCFSRTRSGSVALADKAALRIMNSQGYEFGGFLIDYIEPLNGPDEANIDTMDDRVTIESFEIHSRVNMIK